MSTGLKVLLQTLIPPADAAPEALAAWRMVVFIALITIGGGLFTHITLTNGWMGVDPAYARYSEVHEIKEEMRSQTRRSLEIDVLNLRVRQCEALATGNQDAARFAGETLQERRLEFARVANHAYPLPSCREVGVSTQ